MGPVVLWLNFSSAETTLVLNSKACVNTCLSPFHFLSPSFDRLHWCKRLVQGWTDTPRLEVTKAENHMVCSKLKKSKKSESCCSCQLEGSHGDIPATADPSHCTTVSSSSAWRPPVVEPPPTCRTCWSHYRGARRSRTKSMVPGHPRSTLWMLEWHGVAPCKATGSKSTKLQYKTRGTSVNILVNHMLTSKFSKSIWSTASFKRCPVPGKPRPHSRLLPLRPGLPWRLLPHRLIQVPHAVAGHAGHGSSWPWFIKPCQSPASITVSPSGLGEPFMRSCQGKPSSSLEVNSWGLITSDQLHTLRPLWHNNFAGV